MGLVLLSFSHSISKPSTYFEHLCLKTLPLRRKKTTQVLNAATEALLHNESKVMNYVFLKSFIKGKEIGSDFNQKFEFGQH